MIELIEMVAESLDIDQNEVSKDFIFRDHSQWDSLAALGLITSIEDAFGLVLSDSDLRQVVTVGELSEFIIKRSAKN